MVVVIFVPYSLWMGEELIWDQHMILEFPLFDHSSGMDLVRNKSDLGDGFGVDTNDLMWVRFDHEHNCLVPDSLRPLGLESYDVEERFDMEYFPYTVDGAYSVHDEVVAHFEYLEN